MNITYTPDAFAERYAPHAAAPVSTITGYLIDVENETHGAVTIEHSLQGFYDLLNCRLVEMPTRRIGFHRGRNYTIICNEEGLLCDAPKISAIDNMGQPMLCGNLLIVNSNDEGEILSLDDDDLAYVARFVGLQGAHRYPTPYPMLHQCEWPRA